MHELPIVENIVKVVCDKLEEMEETHRVIGVKLRVGRMSTAVPECLSFYFEFLKKGTPLEGASLEIEEVPVKAKCRHCGKEFEVEGPVFFCPKCDSSSIDVTSGRELLVESVEVED
jgi:hydrogenase nickel incorporation protein HypA/HybF